LSAVVKAQFDVDDDPRPQYKNVVPGQCPHLPGDGTLNWQGKKEFDLDRIMQGPWMKMYDEESFKN